MSFKTKLLQLFRRDSHAGNDNQQELEFDRAQAFCKPCRKVFRLYSSRYDHSRFESKLRSPTVKHHGSKKALVEAAQQCCPVCARIWMTLQKDRQEFEWADTNFKTIARWRLFRHNESLQLPYDTLQIEVLHSALSGLPFDVRLQLHPVEQELARHATSISRQKVCEHSLSDTNTIKCLQGWLAACDEHHECAMEAKRAMYTPPRLLRLLGNHIQLVEDMGSSTQSTQMKYSTLSHCWGTSGSPLCLSPNNYDQLKQRIDVAELPLTFRHAVEVSYNLGIFWIWIDSLCIMQTGPQHKADWNRHVKEMSSIYANGYVNIAASHAADSSQGCNQDFVPGLGGSIKVHVDSKPLRLIEKYPIEDITDWKLNSRAWVLQERLLAPRVIHFGRTDIFFECSESLCSRDYPEGLPNINRNNDSEPKQAWSPFDWQIGDYYGNYRTGSPTGYAGVRRGQVVPDPKLQHWRKISKSYSRCSITRSSDRLPALSGIARVFNETYLEDEYIAGFFRAQLPLALLWISSSSEGRPLERLKPYVAPSWSWMSVQQEVYFIPEAEVLAQVISAEVELIDPSNPYGSLSAARLQIEGWVLPYDNERHTDPDEYGSSKAMYKLKLRDRIRKTKIDFRWDNFGSQGFPNAAVTLLCISESDDGNYYLNGLLLTSSDPPELPQQHVYRRIGYFGASQPGYMSLSGDGGAFAALELSVFEKLTVTLL